MKRAKTWIVGMPYNSCYAITRGKTPKVSETLETYKPITSFLALNEDLTLAYHQS